MKNTVCRCCHEPMPATSRPLCEACEGMEEPEAVKVCAYNRRCKNEATNFHFMFGELCPNHAKIVRLMGYKTNLIDKTKARPFGH